MFSLMSNYGVQLLRKQWKNMKRAEASNIHLEHANTEYPLPDLTIPQTSKASCNFSLCTKTA